MCVGACGRRRQPTPAIWARPTPSGWARQREKHCHEQQQLSSATDGSAFGCSSRSPWSQRSSCFSAWPSHHRSGCPATIFISSSPPQATAPDSKDLSNSKAHVISFCISVQVRHRPAPAGADPSKHRPTGQEQSTRLEPGCDCEGAGVQRPDVCQSA